jgi:hypothetical protein
MKYRDLFPYHRIHYLMICKFIKNLCKLIRNIFTNKMLDNKKGVRAIGKSNNIIVLYNIDYFLK